ncbi:hypothetical protein SODALDRAFT_299062 [Sodiomyces alkalinus F11]|uniref:AB hydrolase-1 domain-containing protein n=1 Tax=Sodiomyces alkalinus (strain CBS 110278 / VKM F-3762 / F11) TaxID=1314773 RepID=A0A3N2PP75_SODAK|nr:hypothetical protein SODALDRAFT_299062 [Sodiomyces alkalinus F11]ROT36303.1 hypothetical protein SODALDRAFT_299062 [Sodiomyces alkalinus F11]
MLPEPTLRFTLPSVHDDTIIDCRVYHPHALTAFYHGPSWKRHAAIVAHPYAPLGGSYDDPIVNVVGEILLRAGFVVGTFNFRGAANSAGRTSWSSKPERGDYMSFVGFMIHYIHFLNPVRSGDRNARPAEPRNPSQSSEASATDADGRPLFVCAGYSYGAMITSQIPPLSEILPQFDEPYITSAAADIRLRAQHLAERQTILLADLRSGHPTSPRRSLGMRFGGDEGEQRRSNDMRRPHSPHTEAKLRKGVNELLARTRASRRRLSRMRSENNKAANPDGNENHTVPGAHRSSDDEAPQHLERVTDLIQVRPAYLLVSPLQGVITYLATMSFFPPYSNDTAQAAEDKLVGNPTLAVFGDRDVFVPVSKLRAWVGRLENVNGSRFHGEEIRTADHFWVEEMAVYRLRDAVARFVAGLVG